MKTILLCQLGEEVVDKFRYFVANVPDEFDLQECDASDQLDKLANAHGIEWEDGETLDFEPMGLWIDEDESDLHGYPMVTLTSEMLADDEGERE
jgi:hypothetical protein